MNSSGLGTPQLGNIAMQPQPSLAANQSFTGTPVNPSIPVGVNPNPPPVGGAGDPNEGVRQRSLSVGGNWVGPGGYYDRSGKFIDTGSAPQFNQKGDFISNASPAVVSDSPLGGGAVTPPPAASPPVRQPAPRQPTAAAGPPVATTGMPGGTALPPVRQTNAPTASTGMPGGTPLPPPTPMNPPSGAGGQRPMPATQPAPPAVVRG